MSLYTSICQGMRFSGFLIANLCSRVAPGGLQQKLQGLKAARLWAQQGQVEGHPAVTPSHAAALWSWYQQCLNCQHFAIQVGNTD